MRSVIGLSVVSALSAQGSHPRSDGGAQRHGCRSGGGLRGHISRLFADVARVLDGFASSCIQCPTVDASIQDIVRCSLTDSSGKRRRLDRHITGLASINRNVSQAVMCVPLLPHINHLSKLGTSFTRPRVALHFRSTSVRNVRASVWVCFCCWERPRVFYIVFTDVLRTRVYVLLCFCRFHV